MIVTLHPEKRDKKVRIFMLLTSVILKFNFFVTRDKFFQVSKQS